MTHPSQEITCRTTTWFKKRRLIMVALLLGFSAYFFYDWKIGYPKQRDEYLAYWPTYQEKALNQKDDKAWRALARDNGWPASPKEKDWDYKIKEQLIWGLGTGAIGLALLLSYLRFVGRTLRCDADSLTTPDGRRIPFASVTKVDKRKWDNKALAYLWWQDQGTSRKAVIDDLVFDGAGHVLDRLMAQFHGELIDLERPPAPPPSDPDPSAPAPLQPSSTEPSPPPS